MLGQASVVETGACLHALMIERNSMNPTHRCTRRGLLAGTLGIAALGALSACGDKSGGEQSSGGTGGADQAALQPSADAFKKALQTAQQNGGIANFGFVSVDAKGAVAMDEQGKGASSASKAFNQLSSLDQASLRGVALDKLDLEQLAKASGTSDGWGGSLVNLKSGRTVISGAAATLIDGKDAKTFDQMMSLEALTALWDEAQALSGGQISGFRLHKNEVFVQFGGKAMYARLGKPGDTTRGMFNFLTNVAFTSAVPAGSVTKYTGAQVAAAVQRTLDRRKVNLSDMGSIQLGMTSNRRAQVSEQPSMSLGKTDQLDGNTLSAFLDPAAAKKVEDYLKNR